MRALLFNISTTVALFLLVLPAGAQAPPRPPPDPHDHPGVMAHVAKVVGLSDSQIKRIKTISFSTTRKAIGLKAKLQMAQLALQEVMTADNAPSEARVKGMVDKIGRLETEMKKLHVLKILRIRKTMSLRQWRKMEALHAEQKMKMGGRPAKPGR
jgi:hypothetical protein